MEFYGLLLTRSGRCDAQSEKLVEHYKKRNVHHENLMALSENQGRLWGNLTVQWEKLAA